MFGKQCFGREHRKIDNVCLLSLHNLCNIKKKTKLKTIQLVFSSCEFSRCGPVVVAAGRVALHRFARQQETTFKQQYYYLSWQIAISSLVYLHNIHYTMLPLYVYLAIIGVLVQLDAVSCRLSTHRIGECLQASGGSSAKTAPKKQGRQLFLYFGDAGIEAVSVFKEYDIKRISSLAKCTAREDSSLFHDRLLIYIVFF